MKRDGEKERDGARERDSEIGRWADREIGR